MDKQNSMDNRNRKKVLNILEYAMVCKYTEGECDDDLIHWFKCITDDNTGTVLMDIKNRVIPNKNEVIHKQKELMDIYEERIAKLDEDIDKKNDTILTLIKRLDTQETLMQNVNSILACYKDKA